MTDRELLEAAAEAAGMKVTGWNTQQGEEVAVLDDGSFWQPLHMNRITNADGDAFRLAVKLRLSCRFYDNLIEVCQHHKAGARRVIDHDRDRSVDMESATRRAIVRAAAALTPSMESNHSKEG